MLINPNWRDLYKPLSQGLRSFQQPSHSYTQQNLGGYMGAVPSYTPVDVAGRLSSQQVSQVNNATPQQRAMADQRIRQAIESGQTTARMAGVPQQAPPAVNIIAPQLQQQAPSNFSLTRAANGNIGAPSIGGPPTAMEQNRGGFFQAAGPGNTAAEIGNPYGGPSLQLPGVDMNNKNSLLAFIQSMRQQGR